MKGRTTTTVSRTVRIDPHFFETYILIGRKKEEKKEIVSYFEDKINNKHPAQ